MAANELTNSFQAGSDAANNVLSRINQREQFQQQFALEQLNQDLAQRKFTQEQQVYGDAAPQRAANLAGTEATTAGTQASTQATNLNNQNTQIGINQQQNLLSSIVHNEVTNLQSIVKNAQANGDTDGANAALAQLQYAQSNPKEFQASVINNYQKSQVQFKKTESGYEISGSGTPEQVLSLAPRLGINPAQAAPPSTPSQPGQAGGTSPTTQPSLQNSGMFAPPIDTVSPVHTIAPNQASALGIPATAPNVFAGQPVSVAMAMAKELPAAMETRAQELEQQSQSNNIPIQLLQKFKALNADPDLQNGIKNQLAGKLPTSTQSAKLQELNALQSKAIPEALQAVKLGRITQREFDTITQSIVNPNNTLQANNNLADMQISNLKKEQNYKQFLANYGRAHLTTQGANEAFNQMQNVSSGNSQPQSGEVAEGTTATNHKTGQRVIFQGGGWQPVK